MRAARSALNLGPGFLAMGLLLGADAHPHPQPPLAALGTRSRMLDCVGARLRLDGEYPPAFLLCFVELRQAASAATNAGRFNGQGHAVAATGAHVLHPGSASREALRVRRR